MERKRISKKLVLDKEIISRFNEDEMKNFKAGEALLAPCPTLANNVSVGERAGVVGAAGAAVSIIAQSDRCPSVMACGSLTCGSGCDVPSFSECCKSWVNVPICQG